MSETKGEHKGESKAEGKEAKAEGKEAKAEGKEAKAKKGGAVAGAPKIADHNETPQHTARAEKKKSRWTVSTCLRAAKRFHSRAQWASNGPSSYKAAAAKGWLDQCCKHMTTPASKTVAPRTKKSA